MSEPGPTTSRRGSSLDGIGVVNPTPFTASGLVHIEEYERHVAWMVERGVRFVLPAAGTGQGLLLSEREHDDIIRATVRAVDGRAVVAAYTGRPGTDDTVRATEAAAAAGADCAFVIQPFWTRPDREGLARHFEEVARRSPIPIVLYNNAQRSGVHLELETIVRVANASERVVGLKQTDLDGLVDAVAALGSSITVMARADKELLHGFVHGTTSAVTFAAGLIPEAVVAIHDSFKAGDVAGARALFWRFMPLFDVLHLVPVPAVVVHALNMMGWSFGSPRLPIRRLTSDEARIVDRVLDDLGLLSSADAGQASA